MIVLRDIGMRGPLVRTACQPGHRNKTAPLHLADGLSNSELADRLKLAETTATSANKKLTDHFRNIHKFDVWRVLNVM